jgi:hypothetical protein
MKITSEQVVKALSDLESTLGGDETVSKASENDLDQPEGADLGNPAKDKMSDAAKAKKKAMDADEDSEKSMKKKGDLKILHEDDEDEDEDEGEEMEMKAKKSFEETLPEEIQTKIEVSGFLKSLVDHTAATVDALRETVVKSEMNHEDRYEDLNAIVTDIQKSQAKIGIVLKAVCERIGIIENAPAAVAKSEIVAKSNGAAERNFATPNDAEEGKLFKSLSENPTIAKSQISSALCDLVKKGEANDLDVIGFESGGYIRPELVSKLKTTLN